MMVTMRTSQHETNLSAQFCRHCHNPVPTGLQGEYCCEGCAKASALIRKWELDPFYKMASDQGPLPSPIAQGDYALFDSQDYQSDFVSGSEGEEKQAFFYLNNLTCYACVWVCEELTKRVDPEARLHINMSTGESCLSLGSSRTPLSEFVKSYEALGFAVTPNSRKSSLDKGDIARLGVAFFCLMNVMMLAFPEYLDIQSLDLRLRDLFRWVSAGLAGLSIFYSAQPILRSAYNGLRQRKLLLDFPIALALLSGYGYSVSNAIAGNPHVYFDSMTAVVALLLVGRLIQGQALARSMREQSHFLEAAKQFVRSEDRSVHALSEVKAGDILLFLPGEVIPVKGRLLSETADISYGLLKGESQMRLAAEGDQLEAGAVNGSHRIRVEATEDGRSSILLQMQKASRSLYRNKGRFLSLSERLGTFFSVFVLIAAALIFLAFVRHDMHEGVRRAIAVLLVACPCVFAFGSPMVIARAFNLGLKKGLVFRSQKGLERLWEIRSFYFDKTGTLTEDEASVCAAIWDDEALARQKVGRDEMVSILSLLPHFTSHHVGKALSEWVDDRDRVKTLPVIADFKEYIGLGVEFSWKGKHVRIGRSGFCFAGSEKSKPADSSFVSLDGSEVLRFRLDEKIRADAGSCLGFLRAHGRKVFVLSGDSSLRVGEVGEKLGFAKGEVLGGLSPEEKFIHIRNSGFSAMVGNGINDSLAASAVGIGIALSESSEVMKEASDICFEKAGLTPLLDAIELSRETRRVLKRCFLIALGFNGIAMSLALSGYVTPAMAAVLMPLSSLTVFVSSQRFRLRNFA